MDIKNCKGCSRLFQYIGGPVLCPICRELLEDKFTEVKAYIYEHRGASVAEVSEATDVTVKQIKQWIREERLVLSDATEVGITCEKCGKPIRSGRFCEKCKNKMTNEFEGAIDHPAASHTDEGKKRDKTGNKMRFL